MPKYDFECTVCGEIFERTFKMSELHKPKHCDKIAKKVYLVCVADILTHEDLARGLTSSVLAPPGQKVTFENKQHYREYLKRQVSKNNPNGKQPVY